MDNSIVMLVGGLSASERVSTAGIVTLQGMLTIFAVLAILWGAVEVMHRLLHREKPAGKEAATEDPTPAVSATANDRTSPTVLDDGAIIAALTAAITAQRADEGNTGAFRVVSFKRAQTASRRRTF